MWRERGRQKFLAGPNEVVQSDTRLRLAGPPQIGRSLRAMCRGSANDRERRASEQVRSIGPAKGLPSLPSRCARPSRRARKSPDNSAPEKPTPWRSSPPSSDGDVHLHLMPLPRSGQHRDAWLNVAGRFQVEWVGFRDALLCDRGAAPEVVAGARVLSSSIVCEPALSRAGRRSSADVRQPARARCDRHRRTPLSPASVRDTSDMYRRLIVVHDGLRLAGLVDVASRACHTRAGRRRVDRKRPRTKRRLAESQASASLLMRL